ncbi:MAG: hypothetical protein WA655_11275 [Candidatus Korobacteraceae bacterium]
MDFKDPAVRVVLRLEERNRLAENLIGEYQTRHGLMDVGIGLAGLFPGGGIPALMVAIGLQAPVIYQPLASKLAAVYLATPNELSTAQNDIVARVTAETAAVDLAGEFGSEFLVQIAGELLTELGVGTAASLIPIIGGFIAAGLDWEIATRMTKRVGYMVAIYFQNGASWVGSKKKTYEMARTMRGDLDSVRDISPVRRELLRNVRAMISMMREAMNVDQIRKALRKQGVPDDLIDEALAAY